MSRRADERGLAMVEAPFCLAAVLLLLMGVVTVTQMIWTHLDLAEAARDATRYATRVEFAPGSTGRHRTAEEVATWVRTVASDAGITSVEVTVERPGQPAPEEQTEQSDVDPDRSPLEEARTGDVVTVTLTRKIENALYTTAAGVTNAMASMFGGRPFDPTGVTVKSEAKSYVE